MSSRYRSNGRQRRLMEALVRLLPVVGLLAATTALSMPAGAGPAPTAASNTIDKSALISSAERERLDHVTADRDICSGNANNLLYPLNVGSWALVDFYGDGASGSGPATGPGLGQRNDDDSATVPLPFTFDLYGDLYSLCFVNQNGNISFLQPFSTFSSVGFPSTQYKMVAAFWGDVDTRSNSTAIPGDTYQKFIDGNGDSFFDTFVVTWDNVGYFSMQHDKRDTFQLVISDGTNPAMGLGNNVCFSYDNMCWTTGSASGGVGGFGGTPATVGANRGNGVEFFQVGRFNRNDASYDGPGGQSDGIDYLDGQLICFRTATTTTNICPIVLNMPPGSTINVDIPNVLTLPLQFIGPEINQTVSLGVLDPDNAQGAGLSITMTPGNPATALLQWATGAGDEGTYVLTFLATDSFSPPCTTAAPLTIVVQSVGPVTIDIDIWPFNRPTLPNRIYISKPTRKIPVLILGSSFFDVMDIDFTTVRFGPDGDEAAISGSPQFQDGNYDGVLDVMVNFVTGNTGFAIGDGVGRLTGELLDSTDFAGENTVLVGP